MEVFKNPIPQPGRSSGVGSSRQTDGTSLTASSHRADETKKSKNKDKNQNTPHSRPYTSEDVDAVLAESYAASERHRLLMLLYRLERDEFDPIADAADVDSEFDRVE